MLVPADAEQALVDALAVPSYGPWVPTRVNIFNSPHPTTALPFSASSMTGATIVDHDGRTWLRIVRAVTTAVRLVDLRPGMLFQPGNTYRAVGTVYSSVSIATSMSWRPSVTVGTGARTVTGWTTTVPANTVVPFDVTFTLQPGDVPSNAAGLTITTGVGSIGETFEISDVSIELASTSDGTPVYGDSPATELTQSYWAGVPNLSQSVLQTRTAAALPVVGTKLPEVLPDQFIRVLTTGGWQRDLVTDNFLVTLEAFGRLESQALQLATYSVARLQDAVEQTGYLGDEVCYELDLASVPSNYPNPDVPTHSRYIVTLTVVLRRRQFTP